jgi:hypothetical protein
MVKKTKPSAPCAMVKKTKPPAPWQNSQAKMILRQVILDGEVVDSMKPKKVFEMRPEYTAYKLANFRSNLKTLRDSIKVEHAKADYDSAALAHDLRIRPLPAQTSWGYPRWDGSDAEQFLKEDIDEGLTDSHKPSELHKTRPEYQDFPLTIFRKHINQELRSRMEKSYWMNRKKKAKK